MDNENKKINVSDNVNDIKENTVLPEPENSAAEDKTEMKLDDARRVKAVSPGLLVCKRFFRNRLALVGLSILIILFAFCFLGAAIYPYSQSQIFTTYKDLQFDYAFTKIVSEYKNYQVPDTKQPSDMLSLTLNTEIKKMGEERSVVLQDGGNDYIFTKLKDEVYSLEFDNDVAVATYYKQTEVGSYSVKPFINVTLKQPNAALKAALENAGENVNVEFEGNTYFLKNKKVVCTYTQLFEDEELRETDVTDELTAVALENLDGEFTFGGNDYSVIKREKGNEIYYELITRKVYTVLYATTLVFDRFDNSADLSAEFQLAAIVAIGDYDADEPIKNFNADGKTYTLTTDDYGYLVKDGETDYAALSVYSVRRYTGEDSISVTTKRAFRAVMLEMKDNDIKEYTAVIKMEALAEDGSYALDDNGEIIFDDEEFTVKTQDKGNGQQFVFRNVQTKLVADTNAAPSNEHILGLDGNAMDVFARIMYGGRISLLIGFIVVIIEIILGTIMGGISGYFGGWVDNLIMRIVDIFYCIPSFPILIILGAMFDTIKLDNTMRVVWMMAVLGFLGWPSIARLVRGQILALRDQDFMIAAEASGLSAHRKIFKHLVPNVMPQLIVQATMGLGSVILVESTLSFLGLGVKYPMATWGQIINSVSSINAMKMYTYIWIPVGLLICLAVIAFNFVGDGLRDAFDPKMNK